MKYIDKTNKKALKEFLKIRGKFIAGTMNRRKACEAVAELCVNTWETIGHDPEDGFSPCRGAGCGTTPECDECGFTPEEVAVLTPSNYSTLVQDLCSMGDDFVKEFHFYERGYKRLHKEFGHCFMALLIDASYAKA